MKLRVFAAAVFAAAVWQPLGAQEAKPVPKDSVRVSLAGCSKGYVFTVGPRTIEQPGNLEIPEGTHLRLNAPKKLMADIKAHEGSAIEVTGLMKKGQLLSDGVAIGGGIRVGPGPASPGGLPVASQPSIDVEGWRSIVGGCRSR